ncbi:hypothetical protein BFINE_55950 [Bacteroides finegoldii DSM 17565]|nr:hypothetical protein BFINE_55950 [Bacteroides finegoldii DSM 17565]
MANDRENGEKALAQLPVKRRVMEDLHLEPNGEESPGTGVCEKLRTNVKSD